MWQGFVSLRWKSVGSTNHKLWTCFEHFCFIPVVHHWELPGIPSGGETVWLHVPFLDHGARLLHWVVFLHLCAFLHGLPSAHHQRDLQTGEPVVTLPISRTNTIRLTHSRDTWAWSRCDRSVWDVKIDIKGRQSTWLSVKKASSSMQEHCVSVCQVKKDAKQLRHIASRFKLLDTL